MKWTKMVEDAAKVVLDFLRVTPELTVLAEEAKGLFKEVNQIND